MLSGYCTEALSIQANGTISGSSTKLTKNGIAPLPFPLPALLKQYCYIKRGARVRVRGHAPFYATLGYILQANPENDSDTNSPPDQLTLEYPAAVVTLEGWRLDLLAQELRFGHVVRVRVVPPPSKESKVDKPHVTRIWVRQFDAPVSDEAPTPVGQPAAN